MRHLGLVVFRLIGENELTEKLLKRLNSRGNVHCVPAALKDKYVIRFTVTSQNSTSEDIIKDWKEIRTVTQELLSECEAIIKAPRARVPLAGKRKRRKRLAETTSVVFFYTFFVFFVYINKIRIFIITS